MDCSGNFNKNRPEVIKAPTLLTVKDEKHHIISRTLVDYEQVETILKKIKDLEARNQWFHEINVLPSERAFLSDLTMKDLVK